jgi:uncharacterized membrane protein
MFSGHSLNVENILTKKSSRLAEMVLFTVVLWIHIIGAIGWLGAAMVFVMVVAPGLAKLTPTSRADFAMNVVPKYVRYSLIFAIVTIIFGIGSLIVFANGHSSVIAMSTPFGRYISAGAILAVVAFGLGIGVTIPSANKIVKITKSMVGNADPAPPELLAASKRMRLGSTMAMAVLVLVTIFMVAGATL